MSAEPKSDSHLEIAHILFIDIVGYSKLLMNEQSEVLQQLNQVVRSTEQFRTAEAAGKLIRIPVGDGMALVFFNTPEAPMRAAVEISEALRDHPQIRLRMGIHSGPVNEVLDVNDRSNVAGAGINMAQRVMNCGDAGHILLSKRVADDLAPFGHWRSQLHELGEVQLKHGETVFLVNFCNDRIGNRQLPQKLRRARQEATGSAHDEPAHTLGKNKWVALLPILIGGLALLLAGLFFLYRTIPKSGGAAASPNAGIAASIPQKSIAVLPFENLSKDEENAFFAGGVQDEILSDLSKIADLKVISHTSVMKYKSGPERNLRDIAKALGVAHILEGSVQRAGGRIRVSAQLIDARNDAHLWAEHYDRELADVFAIQSEIAQKIAEHLRAELSPEEKARAAAKPTENSDAYVCYLQAREFELRWEDIENIYTAERLYERAVALDPAFALAHARLSIVLTSHYHEQPTETYKTRARDEAEKALRLRPDLAEAHIALGRLFYLVDENYERALAEFEIAARALPNDSEVHQRIGALRRRQGRWSEAINEVRQAQALDPQNPEAHRHLGWSLFSVRDWTGARQAFDRCIALTPDSSDYQLMPGYFDLLSTGDTTRSKAVLAKLTSSMADTPLAVWTRWDVYVLERNFDAADRALDESHFDSFPRDDGPPVPKSFRRGCTALARGDSARALSSFEQARPTFESAVRQAAQNAIRHAELGVLYAFMGRKEDAIREGQRAVELKPESKDPVDGPAMTSALALIYARTGEKERAVTLLEHLLSTPCSSLFIFSSTQADLKLRWYWDPLRKDPRFQKLVTGPEPKTIYK